MSVEIHQPFQFVSGRIASTTDPLEQVEKHIWAIVSTQYGERAMLPEFGTSAWSDLFDNVDAFSAPLRNEIEQALARWEPRGQMLSFEAVPSADEGFASGIEIRIAYTLTGFEASREAVFRLGTDMQRQPSGDSAIRNI